MLDIYELKTFLNAAETENFSEAARQLNLTQPAVSMQIRAMEKRLGIRLFHRAGRTLTLTEQGKAFIPMARDIVQRAIQVEEEIETLKGEVVGQLRIGCSTTTGKYYLPRLVARFQRQYPRVQVIIRTQSRQIVTSELCEGLLHLAVFSAYPTCADVEHRHFFDDHVVLVVSSKHPWAKLDVINPQDLRNANFIMRNQKSGTREALELALHQAGVMMDDLNVVMEIGNSEAISMAVEENIGAAFISRTVARQGIELGKLKEIHVTGLSLSREIFISYSHRHPATSAQTEFWNFVQTPEVEAMLKSAA